MHDGYVCCPKEDMHLKQFGKNTYLKLELELLSS